MKEEMGLRKYIVTILDDIRGDNEFPTDEIIQANASLLLTRFINDVREIIGEDEDPFITEDRYGRGTRNGIRAEQRKRSEAILGVK